MAASLCGRVSCFCGGGGCAAPVTCEGCSDAVPDGFADGGYYEAPYEAADGGHVVQPMPSYHESSYSSGARSNSRSKPRGTSAKYFTVTRPGSNQTEYVTAQEYSMIQAERAARAEQVAREMKAKQQALNSEGGDEQPPQITRSPGLKDQTRYARRSGVEKAGYQSSKRSMRLTLPRTVRGPDTDDYIKFDR